MAQFTEGTKADGGKVRMDLIPPDAMFALADVLTFGANKYTTEYETEWDRLLDAPAVTRIELTTAETFVAAVTKNSLDSLTLSLLNVKDRTVGIGKNAILTKLRSTPNVGNLIQSAVLETIKQKEEVISQSLDSQSLGMPSLSKKVVAYADQLSTLTLTIVTKQGNLEVSFAHDVTTDWVFWETIWKGLKEQFDISKPLNKAGSRNWEKGMKWGRVYGALQRHLNAWWGREGVDPETGKSHLWHALCCIVFLVSYEIRGVGEDDRAT